MRPLVQEAKISLSLLFIPRPTEGNSTFL